MGLFLRYFMISGTRSSIGQKLGDDKISSSLMKFTPPSTSSWTMLRRVSGEIPVFGLMMPPRRGLLLTPVNSLIFGMPYLGFRNLSSITSGNSNSMSLHFSMESISVCPPIS